METLKLPVACPASITRETLKYSPFSPNLFPPSPKSIRHEMDGGVHLAPKDSIYLPDLSSCLVQLEPFPIRLGEHSDLFIAQMNNSNDSPSMLAVKVFRAGAGNDPNFLDALQKQLIRLGETWGQVRHDNIGRLHGATYVFGIMPGIVMDYYEDSIISYMKNHTVSDDEKLVWVKQIASGIRHLHKRRYPIIHGNLRGANIFIDSTGKCIITDVGTANIIDMPEFTMKKSAITCRWMAPELMDPTLSPPTTPGPFYTTKTDVFAFAMTVIEVFTEAPPYPHKKNDSSVIFLIVQGERPELPQYIREHSALSVLIPACWERDPGRRPSMTDVCWKLGLLSTFAYYLGW